MDLAVETQMVLGRCRDQEALTILTWSINPQSALNVLTQSPYHSLCFVYYKSVPKVHALMYLSSYMKYMNNAILKLLVEYDRGKSKVFYFDHSKIGLLFFHRWMLLFHPRVKQHSSVVTEERKIKNYPFRTATLQDDQFHLCSS